MLTEEELNSHTILCNGHCCSKFYPKKLGEIEGIRNSIEIEKRLDAAIDKFSKLKDYYEQLGDEQSSDESHIVWYWLTSIKNDE